MNGSVGLPQYPLELLLETLHVSLKQGRGPSALLQKQDPPRPLIIPDSCAGKEARERALDCVSDQSEVNERRSGAAQACWRSGFVWVVISMKLSYHRPRYSLQSEDMA